MLSAVLLCVCHGGKDANAHVHERLRQDRVSMEEVCAYVDEKMAYMQVSCFYLSTVVIRLLRFRELYLCIGGVLFHVMWCIRQLSCPSTIA